MKGTNLGEFEELVLLTIAALMGKAYSVSIVEEIEQVTGRKTKLGVVHAVLNRLQKKGFIKSHLGEATAERGGRRKRFFELTQLGKSTLAKAKEQRDMLWSKIGNLAID